MKRPAKPVSFARLTGSRAAGTPVRRYTVDAAAKALDLLSAFSFREPRLSLADLATRTGIPRPTAFRLLTTLEQAGFVGKVNGEYQLGIKCFVMGNIVAASLDLREKAQRHLEQLREATGETVQLAVLDGWQVVYLERLQSPIPSASCDRAPAPSCRPTAPASAKRCSRSRPGRRRGLDLVAEFPGDDAANDHLGAGC